MATPWTREEVEAVVADYLHMLTLEFAGSSYNKAAYLRALLPKLRDRNKSSVEFKRQNVSAVLRDLGFPWIPGYKPIGNYQQLLFDVIATRLADDKALDRAALAAVTEPVAPVPNSEVVLVDAPRVDSSVKERTQHGLPARVGVHRDYLAIESKNRSLGTAGELLVLDFERRRLHAAGQRALSERVDHVAATRGDGVGYDVLSYEPDGREKFIEVKTTAYDKHTPFFITRNELSFSEEAGRQYHLYRLFEFRRHPQMFELVGAVKGHCLLDPLNYLARFG
jgi:hypothetical protein